MVKNIYTLHEELVELNPDKNIVLMYADTSRPKIIIDVPENQLFLPEGFKITYEDGETIISNNQDQVGYNYHYIKAALEQKKKQKKNPAKDYLLNVIGNIENNKNAVICGLKKLKHDILEKKYQSEKPDTVKMIEEALRKRREEEEQGKIITNLNVMYDKLVELNPYINIDKAEDEECITYYRNDGRIIVPKGFKIVQLDETHEYVLTNRLTAEQDKIYSCEIICKKLK